MGRCVDTGATCCLEMYQNIRAWGVYVEWGFMGITFFHKAISGFMGILWIAPPFWFNCTMSGSMLDRMDCFLLYIYVVREQSLLIGTRGVEELTLSVLNPFFQTACLACKGLMMLLLCNLN